MKKRFILILTLLLINFFLFSYSYKKVVKKEISKNGISKVTITNVNGKIIVSEEKGDRIKIVAEIKGNSKEKIDSTVITFDKRGDILKIKPELPSKNNIYINFIVNIPQDLYLKVTSVNGKILSDVNLTGFSFTTVNGSININSRLGKGKISTVNGVIKVYLKKINGDLSISAVNGKVSLFIESAKNLNLKASTVNGNIEIDHSDLKITYKKRMFPFSSFSTIKARGEKPEFYVKISTVNGSIKVLPL